MEIIAVLIVLIEAIRAGTTSTAEVIGAIDNILANLPPTPGIDSAIAFTLCSAKNLNSFHNVLAFRNTFINGALRAVKRGDLLEVAIALRTAKAIAEYYATVTN